MPAYCAIRFATGTVRLPETSLHCGKNIGNSARLGAAFAGFALIEDATVPDGEIHVRSNGKTVARIETR
jgi:hypothetical protein